MENQQTVTVNEVLKLLNGGSAHATLKDALENLPPNLRGVKAYNLPYSIWQLVEHIRIAQWDMLEFSRSAEHQSPKWPDEYWPNETAPANEETWQNSLKQIDNDLQAFISLIQNADLYTPIPHGDGQNILREALQIADHTSYHTSEIIIIRRLLNAWK